MLTPLVESAKINVSPALAADLLKEAQRLPLYDNREFYAASLQEHVLNEIRTHCRDGFEALVGSIKERIAQWPYCALIQGLCFDEGNRLFVALNRAFGELVALPYKKPRAQLVHYVEPATDIPSPRGGHESERLHTDTTDWETPVNVISMVCVRADSSGEGRSRVLDIDSIRSEVDQMLGSDVIRILETEPVPWKLNECFGSGLKWRPVITRTGMCWRRHSINLALDSMQAKLSDDMLTILDGFETLLSSSTRTLDFLMREGQFLVSDNLRTVHARTPVTSPASQRLMIRSWVRTS
jgi:hypothetical protein